MRLSVAALLILLVAGCGGDDGGGVSSGQDVADLIGCTGYESTSEELYVADGGACEYAGGIVFVSYFDDNSDRDNWIATAEAMGVGDQGPNDLLISDRFVVGAPTDVLEQMISTGTSGRLASDS